MGKQGRRAYLEAIRARYRRAKKAGKTILLNEFCAVCNYHRYTSPPVKGLEAFAVVWTGWLYSQEWWHRERWKDNAPGG